MDVFIEKLLETIHFYYSENSCGDNPWDSEDKEYLCPVSDLDEVLADFITFVNNRLNKKYLFQTKVFQFFLRTM